VAEPDDARAGFLRELVALVLDRFLVELVLDRVDDARTASSSHLV
jgi:hypothetical protein